MPLLQQVLLLRMLRYTYELGEAASGLESLSNLTDDRGAESLWVYGGKILRPCVPN